MLGVINLTLMKLQLKRFINEKILIGIFSLISFVFLVMIVFPMINAQNVSPLVVLGSSLRLNYLLAVAFMFLSYEFIIKAKTNNVTEYLSSLKNGTFSYYISSIGILILALFIFSVIIFAVNTIFYVCNYAVNNDYIIHILLNVILNIFLISSIFILLGAVLTFTQKRVSGYAGMIVVCVFTSPIFSILATQLHSNLNFNIFTLVDLLDFSTPLVDWTPIYTFGFSVLSYRFQQIGFFAFLLIGLIFFKVAKKQKIKTIILSLISVCLSLTFLFMYFQPISKVTLSNNPFNGFASDQYYYSLENTEHKKQLAEFRVNKYKLSLSIDRQLNGVAELYLSGVSASELIFTLYHGYSITDVFDENNNKLEYERVSDYITIHFKTAPQKITINYSGYGDRFYSNSQGISLPGYFPFYPQPGFKNLYNSQEMGFDKYEKNPKTFFEVSVKSPQKVFCNLPEVSFNSFSGEADSITLVSGFYETTRINGIDIVYPYLFLTNNYSQTAMIKEVENFINEHKELDKIKKIIVVANVNNTSSYERMTIYEDHITCTNIIGLSERYMEQVLNSEQKLLQSYVDLYENVQPAYQQLLLSAKENPEDEQNKLVLIFDEKLNLLGNGFLDEVKEYINSDSEETAIEFLSNVEVN